VYNSVVFLKGEKFFKKSLVKLLGGQNQKTAFLGHSKGCKAIQNRPPLREANWLSEMVASLLPVREAPS